MTQPTHRTCPRCGETKAADQFGRDRQRSDQLTCYCKQCRNAEGREYSKSRQGRKKALVRTRRYAKSNPEKVAAATAAWRAKNPGYSAEANRVWREANPDGASAYYRANREQALERTNRRRRALTETTFGPVNLQALWTGACGLCGGTMVESIRHPSPYSPSVDHIVPLSKGGTHEQANLQWTHLVCNLKKGARAPHTAAS